MGTGSRDEFQEAGTSLTRAVQYHGAALERAWWELVGTRVEGARARRLRAINSTVYTFAEQTRRHRHRHRHRRNYTHRQWIPKLPSPWLHAAVDCIGPWAAASARPRPCSCMPDTLARLLAYAYYINPVLGSLHLGFPASCTCPHFANSKDPNWWPAREPRLGLDAVHALHPSILHVPLLPCHRDRSGALCLTRLPARQLCPLTPRS
jgi:hypothetical protein